MKYLQTVFVCIVIAGTVTAQRVSFGIKGGLNIYNIHQSSSPEDEDYKTLTGLHAGLLVNIALTKKISFQPEVVYSEQGTQYNIVYPGGTYPSGGEELKLAYLNIPLLLQYSRKKNFRVEAGIQPGFLMRAVIKDKGVSGTTETNDEYKKADFAFVTGISYNIPRTGLGFHIRYNFGISNLNEYPASVYGLKKPNTYNRGVQVGIFYLIRK